MRSLPGQRSTQCASSGCGLPLVGAHGRVGPLRARPFINPLTCAQLGLCQTSTLCFDSVAAGRKHQLRLHCAHQLQAPILGDVKHGTTRNELHQMLGERLHCLAQGQADAQSPFCARTSKLKLQSLGLQLHSHTVTINTPDRKTVKVTAPVPPAMRGLIHILKMIPQIHGDILEKL